MTTKDTALRLALEQLEFADACWHIAVFDPIGLSEAITACREALAQPAGERGELLKLVQDVRRTCIDNPDTQDALDVLETALLSSDAQPSEWVGLSDEEMRDLEKQFNAERVRTSDEEYLVIYPGDYRAWQRAIEAKLREKNAGKPKEEL